MFSQSDVLPRSSPTICHEPEYQGINMATGSVPDRGVTQPENRPASQKLEILEIIGVLVRKVIFLERSFCNQI